MLISTSSQATPPISGFNSYDLHDYSDAKRAQVSSPSSFSFADIKTSSLLPDSPSPEPSYSVGTAPEEFYTRTLPPWRASARRFVMQRLQHESKWIAQMQERFRSPWLDSYFVYTSALGTHTFFMMALPALFFFGYPDIGRGLIFVLATGVYVSSFMKDLICSPRPYTPPVTRLTIGSHHLEYGFPSTHSTNSVSMALYIYSIIHTHYFTSGSLSTTTYALLCILLFIYAVSIVAGRLYTGMHSVVDCVAGVALGASVWGAHALWWGYIELWLVGPGTQWYSPWIVVLLCGLVVHWHPQPADDCPCFEDAIAFMSVLSGELLARWAAAAIGFGDERMVSRMAGSAWAFFSSSSSEAWRLSLLWWSIALLKLTLGISLIFIWRLAAKFLLHSLLPPFFRWLATALLPRLVKINILPPGSGLPNRRFYTPATEYAGKVPEAQGGLHPIPSVIDLPAMMHSNDHYEVDGELGGMKRRLGKGKKRSAELRKVVAGEKVKGEKNAMGAVPPSSPSPLATLYANGEESASESDDGEDVKHYDADVLTKVVVYAGIGFLATGIMPIMFEVLGWGVHP